MKPSLETDFVVLVALYRCVIDTGVSENSGTPKSSILVGVSMNNHPIFGNIHTEKSHVFGATCRTRFTLLLRFLDATQHEA